MMQQLNRWGIGRKAGDPNDLTTVLAASSIGLDKRRGRWLDFLRKKREGILSRMSQTGGNAILSGAAGTGFGDDPDAINWEVGDDVEPI